MTSGAGSRFCRRLLNAWPREWTHRYATFIWPDLNLDVMLVVADGRELYRDTLDHLGVALPGKGAVIDACHRAVARPWRAFPEVPRTPWKGTPLDELRLGDPDGTLIEIHARLTPGIRARTCARPITGADLSVMPSSGMRPRFFPLTSAIHRTIPKPMVVSAIRRTLRSSGATNPSSRSPPMTTGNVAMATQRVRRASGARIVTEEANDAADHASGCPVETCHDRRQRADVQGDVDRVPRACGDEPRGWSVKTAGRGRR